MPNFSSPSGTSGPSAAVIAASQLHKLVGVHLQFADLTALNAAITAGPLWPAGTGLRLVGEPAAATRIWNGTHASTVQVGSATLTLIASTNNVLTASGKPAGGTGVNGDLAVDATGNAVYLKASGAWAKNASPVPASATVLAPSSSLMVALGDSLTDHGFIYNGTSGGANYLPENVLSWGCALLKQAVQVPYGVSAGSTTPDIVNYNVSASGVTTATVLSTQVPAARALSAGWWNVLAGTNDLTLTAGDSHTAICQRLQAIVEAGLAAGVRVALWTLPPRNTAGTGGWTDNSGLITGAGSTIVAQRAKHMAVNNWIRRYASETPGVVLVDPWNELVDAASSTADWLSGTNGDPVHMSGRGGFICGRAFASALINFVKPRTAGTIGQTDAFDATNNPGGNLVAAAAVAMQGTGGASSGTGVSGTVPGGWTVDIENGAVTPGTAVLVAQARTDGLNGREQQVTLAGASPGNFTLRLYADTITIPAGSNFYCEAEIEVVSATNLRSVEIYGFLNTGSPQAFPEGMRPDASVLPAASSFTAVIRTGISRSSADISGKLMLRIQGAAACAGVIKVRRVGIRVFDAAAPGGLLLGA